MTSSQILDKILIQVEKLISTNNWNLGLDLLNKYCQQNPHNAVIPAEIGVFFQARNMPVKAEMFYLQSLKLDNKQAVTHYNLGLIYQMLNRTDDAINSYMKAISSDPNYARAYANIGYIYSETKQRNKAYEYFQTAIRIEPENAQLKHMIASAGFSETPTTADKEYVRNTFDGYADYYDEHLLNKLKTKTPALVHQSIKNQLDDYNTSKKDILDLGCGTGLCGELFKGIANRLVGVDLSEKMIQQARKKNIYTELHIKDIFEHTETYNNDFDLILASDVFVYLGDLQNIISAAYKAMRFNGIISFTIEEMNNAERDYSLEQTGRYKHNDTYIRTIMDNNKFTLLSARTDTIRTQADQEVRGYVYAYRKT